MNIHFSTGKDDWQTPQDLYDALDAEFQFSVDAACDSKSCRCEFGIAHDLGLDALTLDWYEYSKSFYSQSFFLNPPYSRGKQYKFVKKAKEEADKGCLVVCLLPARTDTKIFHEFIWDIETNAPRKGVEVRFIKGRITFQGAKDSAPFPSMIVIFRGAQDEN